MNPAITIEETKDWEWLDSIGRMPETYDSMTFDGVPLRDTISTRKLVDNANNVFYKVLAKGEPVGWMMAEWLGGHEYKTHNTMTLKCRGDKAITACRLGIEQMFARHGATVLRGACPDYHPGAIVVSGACGFKVDAYVSNVGTKGGKSFGEHHMSLTRDEWESKKKEILWVGVEQQWGR